MEASLQTPFYSTAQMTADSPTGQAHCLQGHSQSLAILCDIRLKAMSPNQEKVMNFISWQLWLKYNHALKGLKEISLGSTSKPFKPPYCNFMKIKIQFVLSTALSPDQD